MEQGKQTAAGEELAKLRRSNLVLPSAKSRSKKALEKMIDDIFSERHNDGLFDSDTAEDLKFIVKDYLSFANNQFSK